MKVYVKLFPTLKSYTPPGVPRGERFVLELPASSEDGIKIIELISHLNIPREEASMAIVNGLIVKDLDHRVREGDMVFLSPLVAGG